MPDNIRTYTNTNTNATAINSIFDISDLRILIAGGCGLIGSYLANELIRYDPEFITTIDILPGSDTQLDIANANPAAINHVLQSVNPNVVINAMYPHTWADHFRATYKLTDLAAKYLKPVGGSILNFGSIYAHRTCDTSLYLGSGMYEYPSHDYEYSPYIGDCGIKSAIVHVSKCLAVEYAPSVRINTISPGGIYDNQHPIFVGRYINRCPMGRMGLPHDLIGPVLLLISNAGAYITAQDIVVDGGMIAKV